MCITKCIITALNLKRKEIKFLETVYLSFTNKIILSCILLFVWLKIKKFLNPRFNEQEAAEYSKHKLLAWHREPMVTCSHCSSAFTVLERETVLGSNQPAYKRGSAECGCNSLLASVEI